MLTYRFWFSCSSFIGKRFILFTLNPEQKSAHWKEFKLYIENRVRTSQFCAKRKKNIYNEIKERKIGHRKHRKEEKETKTETNLQMK